MSDNAPVIWWVRRDLRLDDNPCLQAALKAGGPVIALTILDPETEAQGTAPKWRWGLGLEVFGKALEQIGGRLILRRGGALAVLRDVVAETGARAVHWSRLYDPDSKQRDTAVKSALKDDGVEAVSHPGHLLFEPWTVETKTGGFYKVYTPMWKAVRGAHVPTPALAPSTWPAPETWPASDRLTDWGLDKAMRRAAPIVAGYQMVGEEVARDRLAWFVDGPIEDYKAERDYPGVDATSKLSQPLTYGEIGPRRCWHAAWAAHHEGNAGAEHFLKELVWREFAYHLVHHTPHITTRNWREDWDGFPWNDRETEAVTAWKQGRTGVPFVDAAMREMWVTGHMHNRARMIVASYLTKHLMTDWRIGMNWFADCLTDWDPASNAMGWQWTAGSGPDAAPYFRIYNPETQAERFDADGSYRRAWIAEGQGNPPQTALDYFDAVPMSWGLELKAAYPRSPVVGLDEGRKRALTAYESRKS